MSNLEWLWEHDVKFAAMCIAWVAIRKGVDAKSANEWLMAEHSGTSEDDAFQVDECDCLTETAENVPQEDLSDTREKLEADVHEWSESTGMFPKSREKRIIEWLDRQAAITSLEWCHANEQLAVENDALKAKLEEAQYNCATCDAKAELQETIDAYERNSAVLRDALHKADVSVFVERDGTVHVENELQAKIDELERENSRLSSDELHYHAEAAVSGYWKRKYELVCKGIVDVVRNYVDEGDEGLA